MALVAQNEFHPGKRIGVWPAAAPCRQVGSGTMESHAERRLSAARNCYPTARETKVTLMQYGVLEEKCVSRILSAFYL
jgi:hypothetical protein